MHERCYWNCEIVHPVDQNVAYIEVFLLDDFAIDSNIIIFVEVP
jgi:hypothetical protein